MHALFGSGRTGTRTCVHQGVPDGLSSLRNEAGHGPDRAYSSFATENGIGICEGRHLRSAIDWRHTRDLRAARRIKSGVVRRLACESCYSTELYDLEVAR